MKKVVLKVDLHDSRIKQKAMKTACGLSGVESVSVDLNDRKMILSGDVDPARVVTKLRKRCRTEIVSVGPAKEKEEKEEKSAKVHVPHLMHYEPYPLYYYHNMTPPQYSQSYYATSFEEDPCGCVIC